MPAKGHKAVRNMVATSNGESVKSIFQKFNETHKVCPSCKGKRIIIDEESVEIIPGVSTIKYEGLEVLEELDEVGELTGDVLKNIMEVMSHGGRHCKTCNGFRFVKRSRKKTNGNKK